MVSLFLFGERNALKMILNKREVGKLALLKYLVAQTAPVHRERILSKFNISLSTLKRYTHSMNEDLKSVKEFNQIQIIEDDGYFFHNPTPFNGQYVLKKMNFSYHLDSLQFQLFEKIFSNSIRSIHDLATCLSISLPYLYKLLLDANQFLKPFFIKIDYSINLDNISISGSNENIRLFETYFFWNVTQGIDWLFQNISIDELFSCFTEQEFRAFFDSSAAKQSKFLHSLAVIHQLYPSEAKSLALHESLKEVMAVFQSENDLSGPLIRLLKTSYPEIHDEESLESEGLFFNFMSRIFSSYRDTDDTQIKIGQKLAEVNNDLILYCKQLVTALIIEYPEIKRSPNYNDLRYKLLYFFSLYIANVRYIRFDSSHLQEFMFINPNLQTVKSTLYTKGEEFFNRFLAKNPILKDQEISPFHLTLAHSLIYYFLSQIEQTPLKIYIQFSKNMFGGVYIHSQLYNLFGRENITVVEDMNSADIIISDFYEKRYKSENYFYFDDLTDQESWTKLFIFVHRFQLDHAI